MSQQRKTVVFCCRICDTPLTGVLRTDPRICRKSSPDCTPLLPPGSCRLSVGTVYGNWGDYLVNIKDIEHLPLHPDKLRHTGCCGRDGVSGPNRLCPNGHEVAIEHSDCWMPHYARLLPDLVVIQNQEKEKS